MTIFPSFAKILSQSVVGYMDARDRNQHSQSAKWVIETISRAMREALPQSVRTGVSGDLNCVEYVSILNASSYINLPSNGNITSFNVVSYDLTFNPGISVAVMPISPASIYAGNGVVSQIASITNCFIINMRQL